MSVFPVPMFPVSLCPCVLVSSCWLRLLQLLTSFLFMPNSLRCAFLAGSYEQTCQAPLPRSRQCRKDDPTPYAEGTARTEMLACYNVMLTGYVRRMTGSPFSSPLSIPVCRLRTPFPNNSGWHDLYGLTLASFRGTCNRQCALHNVRPGWSPAG